MKTQKIQMNKGIAVLLINRVNDEDLPFDVVLGKTTCLDQSVAGFDNKQYVQDVTISYEEENDEMFNELLNQLIIEFSVS